MVEEKIFKTDINSLLKNVSIVTVVTIMLLFLVGRYGGNMMDNLTRTSCNAINEEYVAGDRPGEGICLKSAGNIDIKK